MLRYLGHHAKVVIERRKLQISWQDVMTGNS